MRFHSFIMQWNFSAHGSLAQNTNSIFNIEFRKMRERTHTHTHTSRAMVSPGRIFKNIGLIAKKASLPVQFAGLVFPMSKSKLTRFGLTRPHSVSCMFHIYLWALVEVGARSHTIMSSRWGETFYEDGRDKSGYLRVFFSPKTGYTFKCLAHYAHKSIYI